MVPGRHRVGPVIVIVRVSASLITASEAKSVDQPSELRSSQSSDEEMH